MMKRKPIRNQAETILKNSYAKINLYLEVIGRRADGYHQISTVFNEIDLHDEIFFLLTKESSVNICSDIDLGRETDNTVYRAALLMKERYGVRDGVKIELKKNIPVSAGLGGGSSNAATTIRVLSYLWDLKLEEEEMHKIAAEIGSDVNFFLVGGTALGEGRGEVITALEPIDFEMLLLVKPDFGISSADAYNYYTDSQKRDTDNSLRLLLSEKQSRYCFNRLEEGLFKKYSQLRKIQESLLDNGAVKAMVSGSGSTIIGFYKDRELFDRGYNFFRDNGFGCCQTKTKRRMQ